MVTVSQPFITVPPLENGDHLSRSEFEQRYQAMAQHCKAELIEGIVFMASPVRARNHGKPHAAIMGWLFSYWQATPGIELLDNPTVRLDAVNEPQPDACLRIETSVGGRSRITEDDYVEGAPELVVEIAASSASYDLHSKKQVYCRNGVQEYLVWRVLDHALDWFVLDDGQYVPLLAHSDGFLKSQIFPGLWLADTDLLSGNLARVVSVLQLGLESAEYQAFLRSLVVD
ncbi:Uma2 family endonuclease [Alkalinema pantanalense CENA528]|uniref:Uma2 family endonuclease n=1 Tax=Alkalinema pantanalense TaxID=1620705 RepID=UPI003D6FE674